jgi:sulfate/thiosulfate transport system permease protein
MTEVAKKKRNRRVQSLPGFKLTLGYTLAYLSLIVLIPLSALVWRTSSLSFEEIWAAVSAPRALAAYKLSFGAAAGAALIDAFFGLIIAWVLVRYEFPGRKIFDAIVDLPFALPTAVAGIALTAIYAETGPAGALFAKLGIKIAFTPLGITAALVFIGLPFVVRTLQPVMEDLEKDVEEAAACLGATRWQTFRWVIFPEIRPALITGFTLAFARGLGEYGSVVFISGNMPMKTEIAPLLIVTKLESYDYAGATAIALVMLSVSLLLMLVINAVQKK